jgi:hypothetical protein
LKLTKPSFSTCRWISDATVLLEEDVSEDVTEEEQSALYPLLLARLLTAVLDSEEQRSPFFCSSSLTSLLALSDNVIAMSFAMERSILLHMLCYCL